MGQLEDILKHQNMVRNNIMKSFGAETSEDSLEKSFEDEVNPFEMEAYKSELTKAELDEFEKAKHQDGDMHPNGKWVWRQSANGGKGDWRVAKTGGSKATTGGGAGKTTTTSADDTKKTPNIKTVGVAEMAQALLETARASKRPYHTVVEVKGRKYSVMASSESVTVRNDLMNVVPYSNKVHKLALYEAYKEVQAKKEKKTAKQNDDKKKSEKSSYESKEADAYDKGDGKVGNYPVPTHTSYPAANLYSRLKNNRHFGFKYGLPEEEIMKKLKDYKGNVKVSYHNNAETSEIYRIKFL